MHIAYNALLLTEPFSGVEQSILRLARALVLWGEGYRFTFFVGRDFPGGLPEGERARVRRLPVANRHPARRILWEQVLLPFWLRREDFDVLHAPGYVAPLMSPIPFVVNLYDLFALTHPHLCRWTNVWHYRLLLPSSIRRARRVLVPSDFTRREALKHVPLSPNRLTVVPLGVGEEFRSVADPRQREAVRRRYQLPERFVLFVGNLEPKKNLLTALTAWEWLRCDGWPHAFVLTGGKGWKSDSFLERLHSSPYRAEVRLLGYVDSRDLPTLYSLADVFCFPSLVEGFGLPPLEAMACGTPVVASCCGALPEVLGNAALLVPPVAEPLYEALRRVLSDPQLAEELRRRGLSRATQFAWQRTAQATLKVYEQVAEENRRGDNDSAMGLA